MKKRAKIAKVVAEPAPPPPPPTKAERLASFIDYLNSRIRQLKDKTTSWCERVKEANDAAPVNVVHVLDNADGMFEASAALMVFTALRDALADEDSEATLETTAEYARKEALRHARYFRSSTSVTSNLMHACTGAAWAEMAEDLAVWASAPTSPDCAHLADSTVPGDHLSPEPCPKCDRYFVD